MYGNASSFDTRCSPRRVCLRVRAVRRSVPRTHRSPRCHFDFIFAKSLNGIATDHRSDGCVRPLAMRSAYRYPPAPEIVFGQNPTLESRRVLIGVDFFDVTGAPACTACKLANVSSTPFGSCSQCLNLRSFWARDAIAGAGYHTIAADPFDKLRAGLAATTALAFS